jgi:threonine dehydrogenase-like Zn-dependent dehydrogenase
MGCPIFSLSLTNQSLQTNHFNIGALMERGIRLIGNGQAPVHMYWKQLLEMIEKDQIHPYAMLSHRVLVDDLEEVYKTFGSRSDEMQKVFVQTRFSDPPAPGTPELKRFK